MPQFNLFLSVCGDWPPTHWQSALSFLPQ